MKYISVCSGIEAASVAWHPLGWRAAWYSEIEPFPSAVLAHHYPDVFNLGDMTKFKEWPDADVDLLVGGTPCQSFSVAGLRSGLDDPRGQLMLTFGAIARRYRPRWVVWENVPGVLSSDGGRAFGTFLGMPAELGYGFAYRVLDAQYVRVESHPRAVPQRRRRVFVVGHLGDWRRAAAVLFERESLSGYPAPRRQTRKDVAPTIASRPSGGGGLGTDFDCDGGLIHREIAPAITGNYGKQPDSSDTALGPMVIAQPQADISQAIKARDSKGVSSDGDGAILVPMAIQAAATRINPQSGPGGVGVRTDGAAFTLESRSEVQTIAFDYKGTQVQTDWRGTTPTLRSMSADKSHDNAGGQLAVASSMQVRRLTPRECERLQGFPDDWTLIPYRGKPAADGPRYKALGNSIAVNVMRWIGDRIQTVQGLP